MKAKIVKTGGHHFKANSIVEIKAFRKSIVCFRAEGISPYTGNILTQWLASEDFEVLPEDKTTSLIVE